MPGQPGADSQLGGGFISNLANDEYLRVLSQQMPRGAGKIKTDGLVDLGLHLQKKPLDRILDGDDVASAELTRWRRQA